MEYNYSNFLKHTYFRMWYSIFIMIIAPKSSKKTCPAYHLSDHTSMYVLYNYIHIICNQLILLSRSERIERTTHCNKYVYLYTAENQSSSVISHTSALARKERHTHRCHAAIKWDIIWLLRATCFVAVRACERSCACVVLHDISLWCVFIIWYGSGVRVCVGWERHMTQARWRSLLLQIVVITSCRSCG